MWIIIALFAGIIALVGYYFLVTKPGNWLYRVAEFVAIEAESRGDFQFSFFGPYDDEEPYEIRAPRSFRDRESEGETIRCPNCGHQNDMEHSFCRRCGQYLRD